MAHPHAPLIRYVQRVIKEESGVKVSYNWLLHEISSKLPQAKERSNSDGTDLRDELVTLIRPLNKFAKVTT